jgi:hypothetical protein
MGRFVNTETKVVVVVADEKDDRFTSPLWARESGDQPAEEKPAAKRAASKPDSE